MKHIINIHFYFIVAFHLQVISKVIASTCVDVDIICTPGENPGDITWEITKQDNTTLISGVGGETKSACLPNGLLTLVGKDLQRNTWNGATIEILGKDGIIYLSEWNGPMKFSDEETKTFSVPVCRNATIVCTSGNSPAEITWYVTDGTSNFLSGVGGETKSECLPAGTLYLVGEDQKSDGWNGAKIRILGNDGEVILHPWGGPSPQYAEELMQFFLGVKCINISASWYPASSPQNLAVWYQIYTAASFTTCVNSGLATCAPLVHGFGGNYENSEKPVCVPVGQYYLAGFDFSSNNEGWGSMAAQIVGGNGVTYSDKWNGPTAGDPYDSIPFSVVEEKSCPVGSYGITECTNCTIGRFGVLKRQIDEPSACPYNSTNCPHGFFCRGIDRIAKPCPSGTFNDLIGQTSIESCKACPLGHISLSKGSSSCAKCPRGSYCPNSTSKILCSKGTYNRMTMQTSCTKCPNGTVATVAGSKSCYVCPIGHYCPNATAQLLCPPGMSGLATLGSCKMHCDQHCQWCSVYDKTTCLECRHNMYLYNGTCVSECPFGYIEKRRSWAFIYGMMVGNECQLTINRTFSNIVTWGNGAENRILPNIKALFANFAAFAALTNENSIITWGRKDYGGLASSSVTRLNNVKTIFTNEAAFVALTMDNSVVAWGAQNAGGAPPQSVLQATNVKHVFSSLKAFVALTHDNSIIAWGDSNYGGSPPPYIVSLRNIETVFSTEMAFAALTFESSIVAWGQSMHGGSPPSSITNLTNIKTVFSTAYAFAAMTNISSVVAWGHADYGGEVPSSIAGLRNIKTIFSTALAFAALIEDGSVVVWGDTDSGGRLPSSIAILSSIKTIFANGFAFAALKNENSLFAWGNSIKGGNLSPSAANLNNVKKVFSTREAFTALTHDNSISVWGEPSYGGSPPSSVTGLINIKSVHATAAAFAVLINGYSLVVSWGAFDYGGGAPLSVSNINQNVLQIIGESGTGFVALKECKGEYYSDDVSVCVQCPAGQSTNGSANNIGIQSCKLCPTGRYRNLFQTQCQLCHRGKYNPIPGSKRCAEAVPGFYFKSCHNEHLKIGCRELRICEQGSYCNNGVKESCGPGSIAAEKGISLCTACNRGEFSNHYGAVECKLCGAGFYSNKKNSTTCKECNVGKYSGTGRDDCSLCDLGQYNNLSGQSNCFKCSEGKYQDGKGQASCIPCPIDTFSHATGNTALAQCSKCAIEFALHTTTNYSVGVSDASGCVCQGIDETIEGNVGFYTNPTPTSKEDFCLRCPNGASCTNPNTTLATLGTKQGYWRSSEKSNVFHECLNDIDCPGNPSYALQCRSGNTGVICAVCAANYVRFNDNLCTKCDQDANTIGLPLMILTFGIVYIFVLVRYMLNVKIPPKPKLNVNSAVVSMLVLTAITKLKRGTKRHSELMTNVESQVQEEADGQTAEVTGDNAGDFNTDNEPLLKFGSRMRILFGFMQINAALNLTFNVPWSPYFLSFIDISKLVNFDFMWISNLLSPCSFNASYLDVFYLHMWILPIILTFTLMAFSLTYCNIYRKDKYTVAKKKEKMIELAIRMINFVVFLLYPGIGTRIFRLFKCRRIGELEFLMADYSIVCWESDHNYAVAVAVLCIFLYVIGIPFMCIYVLYKRKKELDNAKTMTLYGSLYLAYERKYWYWESVEMLKKIILAGGLVIVATGSSAQVLIGMLVSLAYLIVAIQLKPYDDIVDDYLQIGASIQMVLNLLIGLVLKLDDSNEYDVDALGILLLIMNIVVVLIGVGVACVACPKAQTCCSKKQNPKKEKKRKTCCSKKQKRKKEKKKIEMTYVTNPMQRRTSSKGQVPVKFQTGKWRSTANRRPSAHV